MQHTLSILTFQTQGHGLYEVTEQISDWLGSTGITRGVVTLLCQHTSAGLLITENASSAVHRDLVRWFDAAAPEGPGYEHSTEGPDDMPAHLKAAVLGTSITIPVREGRLALGTWQGIYFGEHRNHAGARRILATLMGE